MEAAHKRINQTKLTANKKCKKHLRSHDDKKDEIRDGYPAPGLRVVAIGVVFLLNRVHASKGATKRIGPLVATDNIDVPSDMQPPEDMKFYRAT